MQDENKMSKYARKRVERARKEEASQRAYSAINLAVRITKGEIRPKAKKTKQEPPEPRGMIADLGDRPACLARELEEAAEALRRAQACADEILAMSKKGIQQAEPRAIAQFLVPTAQRVEGMAARAARILNKVICPGRTGCLAEPNPKRDHCSGKILCGSTVSEMEPEPAGESHAPRPTGDVATSGDSRRDGLEL